MDDLELSNVYVNGLRKLYKSDAAARLVLGWFRWPTKQNGRDHSRHFAIRLLNWLETTLNAKTLLGSLRNYND